MFVGKTKHKLFQDIFDYRQYAAWGTAYGSGKTLFSVAVGEALSGIKSYRTGENYKIIANFPYVLNADLTPDLLDGIQGVYFIFDEAGARYSNARDWNTSKNRDFLSVGDYSRKQDLFFAYPTATLPDKSQRRLVIVRNMVAKTFLDSIGLGDIFWLYWAIPSQEGEEFAYSVTLMCPYAYFGLYDTFEIPGVFGDSLGVLLQRLQERFKVDSEAARRAAEEAEARLRAGESVPGLRPSQDYLEKFGIVPRHSFPAPVRSGGRVAKQRPRPDGGRGKLAFFGDFIKRNFAIRGGRLVRVQ